VYDFGRTISIVWPTVRRPCPTPLVSWRRGIVWGSGQRLNVSQYLVARTQVEWAKTIDIVRPKSYAGVVLSLGQHLCETARRNAGPASPDSDPEGARMSLVDVGGALQPWRKRNRWPSLRNGSVASVPAQWKMHANVFSKRKMSHQSTGQQHR
jgi:hypothetical protein